eukprot:5816814-Prymnesium_polylepis.1
MVDTVMMKRLNCAQTKAIFENEGSSNVSHIFCCCVSCVPFRNRPALTFIITAAPVSGCEPCAFAESEGFPPLPASNDASFEAGRDASAVELDDAEGAQLIPEPARLRPSRQTTQIVGE